MGKRAAAGMIVVAVLGLGFGACSRGSSVLSADESSRADVKSMTAGGAASGAPEASADAAATTGATGTTGAPLPQGIGAPKVVKTAAIDIEVRKGAFDRAFSKVPTIAAAHGGFVSSSTSAQASAVDKEDTTTRQAAGSVVVRVPADQFDAVRQELIALGHLRSQQLKGEDVSAQLTDLDARLRNLRSQEEAIRLLMTKAATIGETIEVQRQLGGVREQIEQLAGEQARVSDAVAMSTLTLSLAEPGAVVKAEGDGSPLAHAVGRAVDGAQSVLAAVIVTLGYLVPLALLLALAWLAARPFLIRRSSAVTPS